MFYYTAGGLTLPLVAQILLFLLGTYHSRDQLASLLAKNLARRPQVLEVINTCPPLSQAVLTELCLRVPRERRPLALLTDVTNKIRPNVAPTASSDRMRTVTQYEAASHTVGERTARWAKAAAEADAQIRRPSLAEKGEVQ